MHERVFVVREEMAVAIEHDRDAGVTSSCSDLLGVSSGGDPESDNRVTKVVDAQRRETSSLDRWIPESSTKQCRSNGMAFGRDEDEVVRGSRRVADTQ